MTIASTVLMIRPSAFGPNAETSATNAFQSKISFRPALNIRAKALLEFDTMVELLEKNHVNVLVTEDTPMPEKPDALFPNNWFSTHPDGSIILYPMLAKNRRQERRTDLIELLKNQFEVNRVIDLTPLENEGHYLESTGSLVLDNSHKKGYACLSQRTNKTALAQFESETGYKIFTFDAVDHQHKPIYHTNVMMFLTQNLAAVCLECISDAGQRQLLKDKLAETKKVVPLSYYQLTQFAGNMLLIQNTDNQPILVGSQTAWNAFDKKQRILFEKEAQICIVDIPIIEQYGGGSARCMMAEIFLKK